MVPAGKEVLKKKNSKGRVRIEGTQKPARKSHLAKARTIRTAN